MKVDERKMATDNFQIWTAKQEEKEVAAFTVTIVGEMVTEPRRKTTHPTPLNLTCHVATKSSEGRH